MAEDAGVNREQPFGGLQQENVTGEEYQRAVENLKRFAAKDVNEITTLEQLAFEMQFVGRGLRSVVLASGEIQETPFTYHDPARGEVKAVDRTYVIRKPLEEGATIYASSERGRAYLDQYRMEGGRQLSNFTASMPFDEEIKASDNPINNILIASAVDWRGGKTVSYYPAKEPNNPDVLRGYGRVVQDGVKNILAVAKPPSQTQPQK